MSSLDAANLLEFINKSPDKKSEIISDRISDTVQNKQTNGFYNFEGFRLDVKKRRLLRGDEVVRITPKEFEVLLLLIENAPRIVEKEELLEKVWNDTFVEEGTLTRNVSWLRKKLAAHAGSESKIIETLPKRGYRFLPEITKSDENALIIEEQIVHRIEIEEFIEFAPSPNGEENRIVHERNGAVRHAAIVSENQKALPAAPVKRRFSRWLFFAALLIFAAATFFVYYSYFFRNQPQVLLATKTVPFSGLPGREDSPAFSPDGRQMVFSWDGGVENGNSDIYVKLIGAGDPLRLTSETTDEINPVFSPDGKSIAFVRLLPAHNEIILMSAFGGGERKIHDEASYGSVSFSPDGKFLAIVELGLTGKEAGIFLINLQTSEKTRLTAPAAPVVDHTPRFSPDGRSLAFIRYFSPFIREIFVVPASGGQEPRQITFDNVRVYGVAWNFDSQKLFFTSYRAVNRLNLWQVSALGGEPQLIETGSKDLQSLAISPNGRTIAFVEETKDENIWQIESNSQPRPLVRSTLSDHTQQFSPDGAQIVFASDRTGNYEIWLSDAEGKNQRQLTDSPAQAGSPRFSPDGKFIAYDAQIEGGSQIYIVPVSGGTPRRLTQAGKTNSLPAWSADGQWIFFRSNQTGSHQIWKIPAAGGEAIQITRQGAFEMFAAPDGKTVIYSKSSTQPGLWRVGTNGGAEEPIPELSGAAAWRSWFVHADGIYYTSFSAQPPFQIKFFDFATGQTTTVKTVEKPPLTHYSNLCVSPNGNKILYARQDQSASSIMLAEIQ